MINEIISFILGSFATAGVLVFFITHPEKVEKWLSMFYWAISKIWKNAEYLAIKTELQGKINSFTSNFGGRTTIQFPRISLKWIAKGSDEIIWEDGEAIIIMRDKKHKNKNFVHAAYFFTSEFLLKKSKKHLSKTQKTSLDLFATQKILEEESVSAAEQFFSDYVIPSIEKYEEIKPLIKQYKHIDRFKLFFPVLIQELSYLGGKVFLSKPTQEIITEVKALTNFLEEFSDREVGDLTKDYFTGKYTRCAIKVVASRFARERGDIEASKKRILKAFNDGMENIYMIGSCEKENKMFVDQIAKAVCLGNKEIQYMKAYRFVNEIKVNGRSKKVKSYLVHLHNPLAVKYLYEDNDIDAF